MRESEKIRVIKKTVFCLVSAAALIAAWYLIAAASSGAGAAEHGGGITGAMVKDFIIKAINSTILFYIIYMLARKPVKNFLSERRSKVEESIKEADLSLQKAKKECQETEEKLAGLHLEVKKLTEQIREEGKKEREKIIQRAEEEAQRIKENTKKNVQREFEIAARRMKEEAVAKTLRAAEEILKKEYKASDQVTFSKLIADEIAGVDDLTYFINDTTKALILSTIDMSPEALDNIKKSIKKAAGREIGVEVVKDPSIGGGIIAKLGSLVFDASIKTQLEDMSEKLR